MGDDTVAHDEPHQLVAVSAILGETKSAGANKVALVELDHPVSAHVEGGRQEIGILAGDDVHLFETEDALSLDSERPDAELGSGGQQGIPHVFAVLSRIVHLPPRFADEADLQQDGGYPGHVSKLHPHVAKLRGRQVDVRQLRERVAGVRPRDVDDGVPRRDVRDVGAHLAVGHPPLEPLLDRLDVGR